jgi:hypothetical protein
VEESLKDEKVRSEVDGIRKENRTKENIIFLTYTYSYSPKTALPPKSTRKLSNIIRGI